MISLWVHHSVCVCMGTCLNFTLITFLSTFLKCEEATALIQNIYILPICYASLVMVYHFLCSDTKFTKQIQNSMLYYPCGKRYDNTLNVSSIKAIETKKTAVALVHLLVELSTCTWYIYLPFYVFMSVLGWRELDPVRSPVVVASIGWCVLHNVSEKPFCSPQL